MTLLMRYLPHHLRLLVAALALASAALLLVRPETASADLPIAEDDFEDDDGWSGLGWLEDWQFDNGFFSFFNSPHSGYLHLHVRESGFVTRRFDVAGATNIHLRFWARARDLDTSTAYAEVSTDGSTYHILQSWSDNNGDDNVYRSYDFDLASPGLQLNDQVWLRFRVTGTGNDGDLFIDDIEAVSVGEAADAPPPPAEDSPIEIDGEFDDWAGKAMLSDPYGDQDDSSQRDIVGFYWANNIGGEVNYHMVERGTTNGQPYNGNNGQEHQSDYILYVDTNNDGDFHDSGDRRVQVTYDPKHNEGKVRVKVYKGNSSDDKISDSGWHDWGQDEDEGGLKFEFAVSWDDLGIDFGEVVRMYLVSYEHSFNHPDVDDRVPNSGNVQWSPASVLGPWLLAGAMALGIVVIWYFKGRRQWTT